MVLEQVARGLTSSWATWSVAAPHPAAATFSPLNGEKGLGSPVALLASPLPACGERVRVRAIYSDGSLNGLKLIL